jgi:glycosidase
MVKVTILQSQRKENLKLKRLKFNPESMEKIPVILLTILLAIAITIGGCSFFGKKKELKPFVSEVVHPEWSKNAVLYEVNVRQYTPEGTFNAFAEHLPRLKALGVDVLWFMPTFPIGVQGRKSLLGSYYSVKDFMDVNPEFGNMDDFQNVINKAHDLGMHVMLDWVPNHTAVDNRLTIDHPEYYAKDSLGKFMSPIGTDWTDVIQLDWSQKGLQDYMINAMKFWVKKGVDGFRVDHPHNTPKEFWERARTVLDSIKPVLMLAEHEGTGFFMEKGFDMNYAWELHHLLKAVAQGKDSVNKVTRYFSKQDSLYPRNVYRLMFLTNHDENSWAGTIDSLFGDSQKVLATLIFTAHGVPLLYSGQEACLNKKLRFFTRDTIEWDTCDMTGFYENLIKLKKANEALWNGEFGGPMVKIKTNRDNKVYAFYREKENNRVVVFLNLTKKKVEFTPVVKGIGGEYTEFFTGQKTALPLSVKVTLAPWEYKVYVKKV